MDSKSATSDLKATRSLAHKLYEQCRKSSGPYRLLAGSVKELRNVLEDLEDVLDDHSSSNADDTTLRERVGRSNSLLQRLDASLQSSVSLPATDGYQRTVDGFKAALDSICNELQLSKDGTSAAKTRPHVTEENAAGRAAPTISIDSTSISAQDVRELRPSSRTSSHHSLARQGPARDEGLAAASLVPNGGMLGHRQLSNEKDIHFSDPAYLQPLDPGRSAAVRTRSSSLGWISPFTDPMSLSFEEASHMILRDDADGLVAPSRPRSRTESVQSIATPSLKRYHNKSLSAAGLGISITRHDQAPNKDSLNQERSRALLVDIPPRRQAAASDDVRSTASSYESLSNEPATELNGVNHSGLDKASENGQLGPNTGPRSIMKSSRSKSSPSIPLSTTSISCRKEGASSDAASLRDELSAVLNVAFAGSRDQAISYDHGQPAASTPASSQSPADFSTPPARRPPSPPRKRAIPKVLKRSSTSYRIVNGELPDLSSSSDEEDLYSTSRPSSPVLAARALTSTTPPRTIPVAADDEDCSIEETSPGDYVSNASLQGSKPRNAEKVLAASVAYTTSSHPTPTESPNISRGAASQERTIVHKATRILDTAIAIDQKPKGIDNDGALAPTEMPLPTHSVIREPTKNEMVPEPGLEPGSSPMDSEVLPHRVSSSSSSRIPSVPIQHVREWYGAGDDKAKVEEMNQLDQERVNHIVHFWNLCAWDTVLKYLEDYLVSLIEQDQPARARRIRHLLGVCLSFKGLFEAAIPHFLSAMGTPICNISEIDDGDCAAAYWLGDCYSLLNRRPDALLAYCIAQYARFLANPVNPRLGDLLTAEQDRLRVGVSISDFEDFWSQEALKDPKNEARSILHSQIVSPTTARSILKDGLQRTRVIYDPLYESYFNLDPNQSRSHAFASLDRLRTGGRFYNLKVGPQHFEPESKAPWPLMYDPFFAMDNVNRGRHLTYECDLIAVFNSNTDAKVPKANPAALGRMDCFTATDLNWLIMTIRQVLRMLEMEWSEVANVEGTWFVVRYTFMQTKIATTHYFTIALFKQSLRAGYGVDICPDGISSSRVMRADWEHLKGVHNSESKRIKKLIRESLNEAAKSKASVNSTLSQPGARSGGKGVVGKSLAAFRQRKRVGNDGAIL